MPRYDKPELLTVREAFSRLTVDDLKPLAALLGQVPTKKGDLVDLLARSMEDPHEVRSLYAGLEDVSQKAVQEATHDPEGVLHEQRFRAKYSRSPNFGGSGRRYSNDAKPTILRLFFPRYQVLSTGLRQMLRTFVPEPPALTVSTSDELPSTVKRPHVRLSYSYGKPDEEEVGLRARTTARAALHDIKAVLRLIDAGEVKVSDKTRRPSQATMKSIAGVLAEGDFYTEEDEAEEDWDVAADLTMQPFAWPLLLQAAALAAASGTRLQLTAAGRKAITRPAHEVIRQVWDKWQKTTRLDEFNRISEIKGQQGKGRGGLTAVAGRRQAVVEVLHECPAEKWMRVEELFRLLKVLTHGFYVSRDPWKLYIGEQQYGSLGYEGDYGWETLQGRFVLAFLFEYAATLGLIDVAYISPDGARNEFRDRWGTDDLSCLSRYDGLMFFRINSLGAWCLGQTKEYEPEVVAAEKVLKVLPNRDVVAGDKPLSPADVLFLEQFAERQSEAVWHLEASKILEAVEQGLSAGELKEFLAARSQEPLPQTVDVFLDDLESKTGQLEDHGTARLIVCKDAVGAQTLANDRRLRKICQLAGERSLVFRTADEAAVRKALRELGYVLPPPR
jgi:hypothetical protein